ncbi:hypothetical protein H4R34_005010, partial [Dimargaris verticillata]
MANIALVAEVTCRHVHEAADPCAFIQAHCSDIEGIVNYLELYYCHVPQLRSLCLLAIAYWLVFLFTWAGISASDYFSPNLATLSKYFRIPDSLAGVTLLAVGNGAPDLFSTFSAIRSGSGALALGQLVGAAAFITSIVAGSMLTLYPFRVAIIPFIREVSFFAITMLTVTWIAWDRRVTLWEGAVLISFYALYVVVVFGSTLWERRQLAREKLETAARAEYTEWVQSVTEEEPFQHRQPSTHLAPESEQRASLLSPPMDHHHQRRRFQSDQGPPLIRISQESAGSTGGRSDMTSRLSSDYSASSRTRRLMHGTEASPPEDFIQPNAWTHRKSLLTAIEFRDFLQTMPQAFHPESTQPRHQSTTLIPGHLSTRTDLSQGPTSPDSVTTAHPTAYRKPRSSTYNTFSGYSRHLWEHLAGHSSVSRSLEDESHGLDVRSHTDASSAIDSSRASIDDELHPNVITGATLASETDHQATIDSKYFSSSQPFTSQMDQSFGASTRPDVPRVVVEASTPIDPTHSRSFARLNEYSTIADDSNQAPLTPSSGAQLAAPGLQSSAASSSPTSPSAQSSVPQGLTLAIPSRPSALSLQSIESSLFPALSPRSMDVSQDLDPTGEFLAPPQSRGTSRRTSGESYFHRRSTQASAVSSSSPSPANATASRALFGRSLREDPGAPFTLVESGMQQRTQGLESQPPPFPTRLQPMDKLRRTLYLVACHCVPTIRSWGVAHRSHRIFIVFTGPIIFLLNMTVPISHYAAHSDRESDYDIYSETELIHPRDGASSTSSEVDEGLGHSRAATVEYEVEEFYLRNYPEHQFTRLNERAKRLIIVARCFIIPVFIAAAFQQIFDLASQRLLYASIFVGALAAANVMCLFFPVHSWLQQWRQTMHHRFQGMGRAVDYQRLATHDPAASTGSLLLPDPDHHSLHTAIFKDALVWVYTSPALQALFPACVGFVSGISWVYLVADEIVAILQSLGVILNISDGILGLTVLALGNSLGDYMTNLTIAKMGLPAMALSACFGGPMLNILLGLGIAATTITSTRHSDYNLPVSNTLFVSCMGVIV